MLDTGGGMLHGILVGGSPGGWSSPNAIPRVLMAWYLIWCVPTDFVWALAYRHRFTAVSAVCLYVSFPQIDAYIQPMLVPLQLKLTDTVVVVFDHANRNVEHCFEFDTMRS